MIRLKGALRKSAFLMCLILVPYGCAPTIISDFDNHITVSNPDKILAFVGRKIRITRFDPAEDDPEPSEDVPEDEIEIIIHMDAAFKARYQILELVHGEIDTDIVDFKVYDHYGFPRFAESDTALIYLKEYDGALYHIKYEYDKVYPTRDNRFAGCGDPYRFFEKDEEIEHHPLQKITFSPSVVFRISNFLVSEKDKNDYSEENIESIRLEVNAWLSAPAFEIKGDRATCKMGVYPDELFRIKNETMFLPNQRYDSCMQKLQIEGPYPNSVEERNAVQACEDEMRLNGLP